MKRWVGAMAFLGATAVASSAMGQEIQLRGPLAGAPSCRRCVLYRDGRFSISPTFGITFQDEYERAMFIGAAARYHFNDIIAIGAWGGFAPIQVQTNLTSQIAATADPSSLIPDARMNIPDASQFPHQVGQLQWMISVPELTLIPLRGKLALFQNIFIDTDLYVFGGFGIVGVSERACFDAGVPMNGMPATPGTAACPDTDILMNQRHQVGRVAFTGTFGVGINFYITHFLSFSVEYRAFPFNWNTSGTDENSSAQSCGPTGNQSCSGNPDYRVNVDPHGVSNGGGRFLIDGNDSAFHWNQMVNFGLNLFLPFEPRRSQ